MISINKVKIFFVTYDFHYTSRDASGLFLSFRNWNDFIFEGPLERIYVMLTNFPSQVNNTKIYFHNLIFFNHKLRPI